MRSVDSMSSFAKLSVLTVPAAGSGDFMGDGILSLYGFAGCQNENESPNFENGKTRKSGSRACPPLQCAAERDPQPGG
jgi:hypothetical protein